MIRFDNILVPVDFSRHSESALSHAFELARAFGARVHLLHCYQVNMGSISPYAPVLPEDFGREIREAAQRKIDEWCARGEAAGVEVEGHLSQLFAPEGIIETAREVGADLIVMGTRGLTGFRHALLGSVAERTVRTAGCPVLTVKVEEADGEPSASR